VGAVTLSIEAQRLAVYHGICAVASNCDGAVTEDGVGFNGQDTMFGRRIAAEPFESWTEAVHAEAARIALTYKRQILAYTGVDMAELDIVREARGLPTNRDARDDARRFERERKAASRRFVRFVTGRQECPAGRVEFEYPYQGGDAIRTALKAAGATFDGQVWPKVWWVAPERLNAQHAAVVTTYGFRVEDAEADAWLEKALTVEPAKAADPAKRVHGIVINDEVVFNIGGVSNWGEAKSAIKEAGARFEPSDKSWRVKLSNPAAAAVVAAAGRVGLRVAQEVMVALGGAQQAATAALTKAEMLLRVSAISRPEELPAEFVALVEGQLR